MLLLYYIVSMDPKIPRSSQQEGSFNSSTLIRCSPYTQDCSIGGSVLGYNLQLGRGEQRFTLCTGKGYYAADATATTDDDASIRRMVSGWC